MNESPVAAAVRVARIRDLAFPRVSMLRRRGQLTGQGLDILGVGRGTVLQDNGAAALAVVELEGEARALLEIEIGVQKAGFGGRGQSSQRSENDGVLHSENEEWFL